jgi:hypothetical protein
VEWPDVLVIQQEYDPGIRRFIARLEVTQNIVLKLWVDGRRRTSCISVFYGRILTRRGVIQQQRGRETLVLRNILIAGQLIPDVAFEIDPEVQEVDGVLGWSFFRHYDAVEHDAANHCFILRMSPAN